MLGFPGGSVGKESACNAADSGDSVWSTAQEDPLEKGVATHSSIFAWRILWAKDPGRGQTVHGVSKSPTQLKWLSTQASIY